MQYLSASRLELFEQCELLFKMSYIEVPNHNDPVTDWYATFGKFMHDMFEYMGNPYTNYELWQFVEHYNKEFPKCGVPEDKRGEYYQKGLAAVNRCYLWLRQIKGNIVMSELEFTEMIEFGIPKIHGFIDLVYRDEEGRLIIRDYKSSKPYSDKEIWEKFQPYLYALAVEKTLGERPFLFEYDFFMTGDVKSVLIDDTHMKLARLKLKAAWKRIRESVYPASYDFFYCKTFCSKRSLCPLYLEKNS